MSVWRQFVAFRLERGALSLYVRAAVRVWGEMEGHLDLDVNDGHELGHGVVVEVEAVPIGVGVGVGVGARWSRRSGSGTCQGSKQGGRQVSRFKRASEGGG